MTHGAVRAAANKFVPFFEGYDAAPVSAKMPARPNRDSHAGGGENNAAPPDGVARRNEAHPPGRSPLRRPMTIVPQFAPFRVDSAFRLECRTAEYTLFAERTR